MKKNRLTSLCFAWSLTFIVVRSVLAADEAKYQIRKSQGHRISKRQSCRSSQFQCLNENCVSNSWLCDGDNDCGDSSDEDCGTESCPIGQFKCNGGRCIVSDWLCDDLDDCGDNSDETGCGPCSVSDFRCDNGYCESASVRCNGVRDCVDGSDEWSCPATTASLQCDSNQWRCTDGSACVSFSEVCNGASHCNDNSDEFSAFCLDWLIPPGTEYSTENPVDPWRANLPIGLGAAAGLVIIIASSVVGVVIYGRRQVHTSSRNGAGYILHRPPPNSTVTHTPQPNKTYEAPSAPTYEARC